MKKFTLSEKDLNTMASEVGAREVVDAPDLSDDPFDSEDFQQRTLSFNKDKLAWITSNREYLNCIRLDDSGFADIRDELDDSRSL